MTDRMTDGSGVEAPSGDSGLGYMPVVVGANWYRFRQGEILENRHVMSVCFIWVARGSGTIRAGGRTFRATPNNTIRLPWQHRVQYTADAKNPFHIGTLHVVPRHLISEPVQPRVAFRPGDPLLTDDARRGDPRAFAPGMAAFELGPARRIADLGTFAVDRFTDAAFDVGIAKGLAEVVLAENQLWEDRDDKSKLPAALEAMMSYVRLNVDQPLSVEVIAQAGSSSPATAERLFNRHLSTSVQAWTRNLRLREAAHLLRTTGLRVSEVAAMVGYADPLYFSRAFRSEHGVPPSMYATKQIRP